jgi:hydrogenase expression/formation protein HypC
MCLAIPGKVIEVRQEDGLQVGKVSFGGMVKQVCLEYTPDAVPGDYVLVHVGFALSRIDEEEAERTYKLLEELGDLE